MKQSASDRYNLVAEKWFNKKFVSADEYDIVMRPCKKCIHKGSEISKNILFRFRRLNQLSITDSAGILSFPIFSHGQKIAVICLYLGIAGDLSEDQTDFLRQITTESLPAILVEGTRGACPPRSSSSNPADEQIARYLHDTLVNDLSFLKLKIDQLLQNFQSNMILDLREEINQMRIVADRSHRQVRNLLSNLHEITDQNLEFLLEEYIQNISCSSGIEIDFINQGQSHILSTFMRKNVVYVIKESLRNIEKHARAKHAQVVLSWDLDLLTIQVSDDGVGFDLEGVRQKPGHVGLKVMQECAQEINARLQIDSALKTGTQVTLALPL